MLYSNKKKDSSLKNSKPGFRYSSKDYHNPFFSKKKRERLNYSFTLSWKIKLAVYSSVFLLLAALALALTLPYFKITQIEIKGQGNVDQNSVRTLAEELLSQKIFNLLSSRNIFIFRPARLEKRLRESFVFQSLVIKKKIPDRLLISYIEEKYAIIYEEEARFFYADENGNIIKEADILEISQKEYPIVKNSSTVKSNGKTLVINQELLAYIIAAYSFFNQEKTPDLNIEYFQFNDFISNDLWLKLKDGPMLYFDAKADFPAQFKRLLLLKMQKLSDSFFSKEYIDLRFGESIYYR